MNAEERTQRIQQLRDEHKLTAQQIADQMNRSLVTVYGWLNGNNPITDHSLELLELKLSRAESAHDSI